MNELPIETQFAIATFNSQVDRASHDQAKELAKQAFHLYQTQKHVAVKLFKQEMYSEG